MFEGFLSRYDKKTTIAILVARYENRIICAEKDIDIFTYCARNRARSSEYNIILTDESNVYSDLINFIETHPLDSSNNNGGWGTREELNLIIRRIEMEIKEEVQRWREEMERENRELRNEIMRLQIEQVQIQKGNSALKRELLEMNRKMFIIWFLIR